MKKDRKIFYFLLGMLVGIIITNIIYQIPRIKYDTNRDGKITLNDAVKVINYYRDKRIKESE